MIYHISANEGETGYLVIADNQEVAKSIVRKYYREMNDENVGKIEIAEVSKVKEGLFACIDWTEPEPPIFNI